MVEKFKSNSKKYWLHCVLAARTSQGKRGAKISNLTPQSTSTWIMIRMQWQKKKILQIIGLEDYNNVTRLKLLLVFQAKVKTIDLWLHVNLQTHLTGK